MQKNRTDTEAAQSSRPRLTADVARRGIYIDLRGVRGRAPVICGLLVEERFDQVIFDTDFADAALARELRINSLESEVLALLQAVREDGRCLFGFSPEALNALAHGRMAEQLRPFYRDGQQVGADWCARRGKDGRSSSSLGAMLSLIGAILPLHLESKATTKRLRDVRVMMQARGAFDAMTPIGKGKWTKLLKQNRARCEGLRTLMLALSE
jgi:hypothetical protein